MTQTLRRELRIKFKDILEVHFGEKEFQFHCCEELTDSLADAALEVSAIAKQEIAIGISNKIFAGQPVTEADVQIERNKVQAPRMFEKALGTGTWPWSSNNVWVKFEKFVCEIYARDPQAFGKYIIWRAGDGKYTAMNNKQIRAQPQVFMDTGWPEFEKSLETQSSQSSGRGSERLNR